MASLSSPALTFSVKRCEPQLVVPVNPTPHELKELSDIDDQQGLRFQIRFIMSYSSHPSMNNRKDPAGIIREALGKALVLYYPFAGRLIEGPCRKLVVDCNNQGILFVEADADVTIEQLGDNIQPSCPCIEELLHDVPGFSDVLGCPLLLIQLTRLACGGFIFAVRLNHTMSDSLGLAKFLNAVGEFARGAIAPSLLPVWQREILNARNPPRITCVHHEYEELKHTKDSSIMTLDSDNSDIVHRSFFFGPTELNSIRQHLPLRLKKCSNFEVLTACLWRSWTTAFQLDTNEVVRLSCMINLRGKQGLQVPPGYYGNAFAYPTAISRAGTLCKSPLGYAVELVRRLKTQMNEEYIKSAADLMVLKGRPHYTTVWNFLVADATRTGLEDVDFGWGKPIYGGPTGALPHISLYGRFKNSRGESGVVTPLLLPSPVMDRFEQELFKMTRQTGNSDGIKCPRKIAPRL